MPDFLSGVNVAGNGMRERLRSTTFALLGLVTAVGLILVGIAYNQGWPAFVDSPIPISQTAKVGDAAVVASPTGAWTVSAGPTDAGNGFLGTSETGERAGAHGPAPAGAASSEGNVTAHEQVSVPVPDGAGVEPAPAGQGPADAPATPADPPAPTPAALPTAAEPPTADPRPAPAPVSSSPPTAAAAPVASVPGKGKAKGHEKRITTPPPPPAAPPAAPSVPAAPPVETPAAIEEGPGNGHGNANGHKK